MAKRPTRPTTRARAAAAKLAHAARADRDARLAQREARLTDALTDFYAAHTTAAAVRADARRRADAILADAERRAAAVTAAAEQQAATAEADKRAAVATISGLGERPGEIADLCGLRVGEVRALLAEARSVSPAHVGRDDSGPQTALDPAHASGAAARHPAADEISATPPETDRHGREDDSGGPVLNAQADRGGVSRDPRSSQVQDPQESR